VASEVTQLPARAPTTPPRGTAIQDPAFLSRGTLLGPIVFPMEPFFRPRLYVAKRLYCLAFDHDYRTTDKPEILACERCGCYWIGAGKGGRWVERELAERFRADLDGRPTF
jgi:hypothetical protein